MIPSPVVLTGHQEPQANTKSWNTAYKLWKLKINEPHLFSNIDKVNEDPDVVPRLPPGFKHVTLPRGGIARGWLAHSAKQFFLEEKTDRCVWFDTTPGVHRELHDGDDVSAGLSLVGSAASTVAATAVLPSKSKGISTAERSSGSTGGHPLARHLVINDLHKAAEVFKLDLAHLGKPAAMLAVYGSAEDGLPPDVAVKSLHEPLLRRLAAFRGRWSDEALKAALVDTMSSVSAEHKSVVGIVGAVVLILGAKLVVAVANGASCAVADSLPDAIRDVRRVASASGACIGTALVELDRRSASCVLLQTNDFADDRTGLAASHVARGRAHAGAVTLLGSVRGERPRAAACAQLAWMPEDSERPAKRARTFNKDKVRCRQILLKYVGCNKPHDPVRRKPVQRSLADSEAEMLDVLMALEELNKTGTSGHEAAFTQQCRAVSECPSSLKGGDLAGDIGWLKLPELKPGEKLSKEAAARLGVVRAALALDIGEISDIVVSEDGVHLLKRSA